MLRNLHHLWQSLPDRSANRRAPTARLGLGELEPRLQPATLSFVSPYPALVAGGASLDRTTDSHYVDLNQATGEAYTLGGVNSNDLSLANSTSTFQLVENLDQVKEFTYQTAAVSTGNHTNAAASTLTANNPQNVKFNWIELTVNPETPSDVGKTVYVQLTAKYQNQIITDTHGTNYVDVSYATPSGSRQDVLRGTDYTTTPPAGGNPVVTGQASIPVTVGAHGTNFLVAAALVSQSPQPEGVGATLDVNLELSDQPAPTSIRTFPAGPLDPSYGGSLPDPSTILPAAGTVSIGGSTTGSSPGTGVGVGTGPGPGVIFVPGPRPVVGTGTSPSLGSGTGLGLGTGSGLGSGAGLGLGSGSPPAPRPGPSGGGGPSPQQQLNLINQLIIQNLEDVFAQPIPPGSPVVAAAVLSEADVNGDGYADFTAVIVLWSGGRGKHSTVVLRLTFDGLSAAGALIGPPVILAR